jgi:PhzF family phenazine biosynthesis protein
MAIIPFHIVDAFASRPFTGNPAAIIPNASCLTEAEMLQITGELSMEAGFVLPPDNPRADLKLRFFTRRREAALSGHVVIAAFASMADRGFYRPTPEGLDLLVETGAGLLPVRLQQAPDGQALVTLRLPGPRFGEPVPAAEVAAALGVPEAMIGLDGCGPQRVSCGFDQVVVPVCDRQAIRGAFGAIEAIGALADRRGAGGLTLFCPDTYGQAADFHCRFFHPRVGADEDVASGTALGAVAAYVVRHGLLPAGEHVHMVTEQGHSLGRPNLAELTVHAPAGHVATVDLTAGGAVVMRGSFHFQRQAAAVGA